MGHGATRRLAQNVDATDNGHMLELTWWGFSAAETK